MPGSCRGSLDGCLGEKGTEPMAACRSSGRDLLPGKGIFSASRDGSAHDISVVSSAYDRSRRREADGNDGRISGHGSRDGSDLFRIAGGSLMVAVPSLEQQLSEGTSYLSERIFHANVSDRKNGKLWRGSAKGSVLYDTAGSMHGSRDVSVSDGFRGGCGMVRQMTEEPDMAGKGGFMKRIMGVYDVDPFYADRFAEFANQKERIPFTVVAFTGIAKLQAFTQKQPLELLLVGDEVDREQLAQVKAEQVIRLSESREIVGEETPVIYKYQASDTVLREVMAYYQVRPEQTALTAVGTKSMIMGVYSPVNRCGKTGFCLTLGQILARESRVLFLSLEEHSGLSRLTGTVYTASLSNLIYKYREGGYTHMSLGSVLYNWGGMDYIPPAAYAEDLAELRGEELGEMIARIAADGIYEVILADIGHLGRGMEPLLELCDIIYTPVKEDCVSAAKLEAWQEYLDRSGRSHLWERVRLLKLPRPGIVWQTETYLEQLLWGEMGDFVRTMLKGQRGEDGM